MRATTIVRRKRGAEAGPASRFRPRDARGWAVPAVAALHCAAAASLAVASVGAGLALCLG